MGEIKFDYTGKVVLVTGAGTGIGEETALQFAKSGAKVMVTDYDEKLGLQTCEKISALNGEAAFFHCDVSDPQQVLEMVKATVAKFGALHVCCNNAGIEGAMGPTAECSLENFEQVIDTNLKGVFYSMRAEIPALLKSGGGAIINLSSVAGLVGFPGLPAYVASKHGVIGLTRTAALEYASQGIAINAVCPGPIMTPMLERIMASTPGFKENLLQSVPEGRIGTVKEVAQTILYLGSEQARYVTGQAIAIDGGMVAG